MKKVNLLMSALCLVGTMGTQAYGQDDDSWLINAEPVPAKTFKEVVWTHWSGYNCTSTLIGPRVVLSAAHCAKNNEIIAFSFNGKQYAASFIQSPLYKPDDLETDHDIAVGIVEENVEGVKPATIGSKAIVGKEILLLGLGCTNGNGSGGNDGVLRMGYSQVNEVSDYVMISKKTNGAVLCFGDSGGPTYAIENGKRLILGNHAASNLKDTNFDTRSDSRATRQFLLDIADEEKVEICGINVECESLNAFE